MIGGRALFILTLVTALAITGTYLLRKETPLDDTVDANTLQPVISGLLEHINDISKIRITAEGKTSTLEKSGDVWRIKEKSGYAAELGKVRQLLLGISGLRSLETKTSNPELYGKLGLEDPSNENAQSTQVQLVDANQQILADLIIGKQRPSKTNPQRSELYIRMADTPQSWLVEGQMQLYKQPEEWIDTQLFNIDIKHVAQVTIEHPDGEKLVIAKDNPEATDFQIKEPTTEDKIASVFTVNNIASTFARLPLEDVAEIETIDFSKDQSIAATLDTFNGLRINMETVESENQTYARFNASTIEPIKVEVTKDTDDTLETKKDNTDTDKAKPTEETEPQETVEEKASSFNNKFAGWAFVISTIDMGNINKKLSDLVEKKVEQEKPKDEDAQVKEK